MSNVMTSEANAQALLIAYQEEIARTSGPLNIWRDIKPSKLESGRAALSASPAIQAILVRLALESQSQHLPTSRATENLASHLARRALPYTVENITAILTVITTRQNALFRLPVQALLRSLARPLADPATLDACRPTLESLQLTATRWPAYADRRKFLKLLEEILAGQTAGTGITIAADEWGNRVRALLDTLDPALRDRWLALLCHCATATSSAPSAKWRGTARTLRAALEEHAFLTLATDWIAAFAKSGHTPPTYDPTTRQRINAGYLMTEDNATLLRGLIWCCAETPDATLAAVLADAAISGYRKIPGIGPRSAKIASACVYALKEMPELRGAAQLERVRLSVKQPTYRRSIERALDEAAQRAGMTRGDLEELTIPTFDLDDQRHICLPLGDALAELSIAGSEVRLQWYDAGGKPRKTPPAAITRDHKAEVKDLKRQHDEMARMLTAQRDRIERLPLTERQWTLAAWRERYLDHPLVGALAQRLIWRFTVGERTIDGIWCDGQLVDAADRPLDLPATATVAPWHPALCPADDVLAWRDWLERHQIAQPFKQAHREVYLLTDAERATRVYSNRFAAHILRQHQFNALAAARGWRNTLRLMVDDEYPPATLELPQHGLRAEFWIEGAGDTYEADTNGTGTYLRVSTDQVRFYRTGAAGNLAHASGGGYSPYHGGRRLTQPPDPQNAPIPLEEIPPLVFSEVMRDVDLFVGVASVGNDPTWNDGGPQGRYRDYWQSYSFGELSATAETRKQILARLVPRLAIADRCALDGRFLRVRGDLRTYQIHLGSGNILMEPNNQYLCIVPSHGASGDPTSTLFLPFEGDGILSLILSKACLLADDTAITDPTILRQIRQP